MQRKPEKAIPFAIDSLKFLTIFNRPHLHESQQHMYQHLILFLVYIFTFSSPPLQANVVTIEKECLTHGYSHEEASEATFECIMDNLYSPIVEWRSLIDQDSIHLPARHNEKKLENLRIAIDPGHVGGKWGKHEGRSFSIKNNATVQEGDLTLAAARRIKHRLETLGATVILARNSPHPVTDNNSTPDSPDKNINPYNNTKEIEARARIIASFNPDLSLVLHVNAEKWETPYKKILTHNNTGHIIINGGYLPNELKDRKTRTQMLNRISKGYHNTELPLSILLAQSMAKKTGLPPYTYKGNNALKIDKSGYIWARNLLANRIYESPVIYLEPWIANNTEVYIWASLGDYEGTKLVGDKHQESLPKVYCDFVLEGLIQFYNSENSE